MSPIDIVFGAALLMLLLPVCIVDINELRIPNLLNAAIAVSGLAWHALHDASVTTSLASTAGQALMTLLVMMGCAWIITLIRKDARIGWGDLKFLAAAACWVGFEGSIAVLVLACLAVIAVSLALAPWRGLDPKRQFPFGPPLALGLVFVFARTLLQAAIF